MSKQQLNIRVEVADKLYRLQVNPEEEEFVRIAARHIKQKIYELKGEYASGDKQDYLAMVCLLMRLFFHNIPKIQLPQDQLFLDKNAHGAMLKYKLMS